MVETKDYIFGTITLALLLTLGISATDAEIATHYCNLTGVVMECDHLSSTGYTCYPYNYTNVGKKLCRSGWLGINRIAYDNSVQKSLLSDFCENGVCVNYDLIDGRPVLIED